MPTPSEHLAASLERLKALQRQGRVAVRARDLPRVHRERLSRNGFLHEVMKGWYIPARPGDAPGETTAWYSAFWPFAAQYLESRFEDAWCLSADQSLLLHVGDRTVPPQLLVRSPKGANKPTPLPHGTSVFDVRLELPAEQDRVTIEGVRMMTLAAALEADRSAGVALVDPEPAALAQVPVSYTHLRAHETVLDLVCRLLLE